MENVLADLIQLIGQNMPEIRLVDEDYGQLENLDEGRRVGLQRIGRSR